MNINLNNIYEWPMSRRILVLILILAVSVYAGYWWDLSSLRTDLEGTKQQENDLKQQLQTIVDKQVNLKDELAQLTKLQVLLTNWQKKLIIESELPEAMNEILKLGANNQLYFILFSPSEEAVDENYLKVPIKSIVVGSYHQIGDFLSQLANMKWIVVIRKFNISNENKNDLLGTKLAEQANTQGLLTAELALEIYKLPQPGELEKLKSKDVKPGQPAPPPGAPTPQTPAGATPPPTPATASPPPTPSAPQGSTPNAH